MQTLAIYVQDSHDRSHKLPELSFTASNNSLKFGNDIIEIRENLPIGTVIGSIGFYKSKYINYAVALSTVSQTWCELGNLSCVDQVKYFLHKMSIVILLSLFVSDYVHVFHLFTTLMHQLISTM